MTKPNYMTSFHDRTAASTAGAVRLQDWEAQFTYTFENFFHPFVGELIAKLNKGSLADIMDAKWHEDLEDIAGPFFEFLYKPTNNSFIQVKSFPKKIDVFVGKPYANYNWELFFHIPLTIAVHLSKTQRFAEAQRWFHYIFDPTSNDQSVEAPRRFWKFLAFRNPENSDRIEDIVRILSVPRSELSPDEQSRQDKHIRGYDEIRDKPFQPHAVARTRPLAYQYCVVMKYLDNLIAWGDHLFQQDTLESINEATQLYVLAANILGERPQRVPQFGKIKAKTFAQMRNDGLGPIGNVLAELEAQFPLNLATAKSGASGKGADDSSALFGIGRTLYFCIPRNDKLLGYWDTVGDRLFKIRHGMNIAGVVRPLALFDPSLDPGMLVKAAAAGIDIGSIVSGLNQPIGPARSLFLIQKALELCGEVRSLGNALLSALEKGDAENLALVRQRHEIQIQQMAQEVRFLQWKSAQESTTSLLTSRKTALERLHYYQRLLGLPPDQNAPADLTVDHSATPDTPPKLNADNFEEAYNALVGQYDVSQGEKKLTLQSYPELRIAGDSSPSQQSGASGQGRLYLNANEDAELNDHLPTARDSRMAAAVIDATAGVLNLLPEVQADLQFWGLGFSSVIFGGMKLAEYTKSIADVLRIVSVWEQDQAGMTDLTARHERRADEWILQYNLAAHELMQIGRQILTSLIAEQVARHEYLNIRQQIANAQEVDQILHEKFTNEDLYLWMQGEIFRLYYEYYRFAIDTARKAEKTMKQELMRPDVDAQDFVKFNYWDGGRKGLLSGEALYLDVKRMEMSYHDNNKRELELTKHVSLRQLNPVALLTLKATGTCQVTIPEWLYDLDCPGHYMRRIKSVALSIPSVVGPYTSLNCTLSLLKSTLRKSPIAGDDYTRQGSQDDRFVDYIGAVQSVVTSTGQNDSGMFETNLREERFLPFEGAGAESTWKLDLPKDYRAFDYDTISDVVLHIRYTARQGVDPSKVTGALSQMLKGQLALLFSLPHDFPSQWSAFVNAKDDSPFTATIRKDYFPYFAQGKAITIDSLDLYNQNPATHEKPDTTETDATEGLGQNGDFTLTVPPTSSILTTDNRKDLEEAFLIVRYSI